MFQKGHKKVGGRKKGTVKGRTKAFALLDKIFGDKANLQKLRKALQDLFDADPLKFFKSYGIALMPRDASGDVTGDESGADFVQDSLADVAAMDNATVIRPAPKDKPDG